MGDSTWASGTDLTGRKVGERMNENLHPEKHAYPDLQNIFQRST